MTDLGFGNQAIHIDDDSSTSGKLQLRLPCRELGSLRHIAWLAVIPIALGGAFFFTWFSFIAMFAKGAVQGNNGGPDWILTAFCISFALGGLFGVRHLLRLLLGALCVLLNRTYTSIRADGDRIQIMEHFFWVRFKRECELSAIRTLQIDSIENWNKGNPTHEVKTNAYQLAVPESLRLGLVANRSDGQPFLIAVGYPPSVLQALRTLIDAHLQTHSEEFVSTPTGENETAVATHSNNVQDEPSPRFAFSQPKNSKAIVDRRTDGITITIPPAGYFEGSHGLLKFAIFWNCFFIVFQVISIQTVLRHIPADEGANPIYALLFVQLFQAVGIALLVYAIYIARQRITIATSYGMLMISTESIFGKKTRQWESEDILAVQTGPSGTEINDKPLMELQVLSKSIDKYGGLRHLDDAERLWIVDEIQRSLGLSPPQTTEQGLATVHPEFAETGIPIAPNGTKLVFETRNDGWQLSIPPHIPSSAYIGALVGIFCIGLGIGVPVFVFGDGRADVFKILFFVVWSGMFISFGVAILGWLAFQILTQVDIISEQDRLVVRRQRPWRTKEYTFANHEELTVECTQGAFQSTGAGVQYQLSLRGPSSKPLHLMASYPAQDLVYVRELIKHSRGVSSAPA